MKHSFLAIFSLVLSLNFNLVSRAANTPTMTPQEAIAILQTSRDLPEIVPALKIAILNPATRAAAVAYLDGPFRDNEMEQKWYEKHLSVNIKIIENPVLFAKWEEDNEDISRNLWEGWHTIKEESCESMVSFFAANNDPAIFEVFKHFVEGGFEWQFTWAASICSGFSIELKSKPNSPLEPLFLDYIEHLMSDIYVIGYNLPVRGSVAAGSLDIRTNEFRPYMIPESMAAIKMGPESKTNILGKDGPEIIFAVGSEAAKTRLLKIVALGKFSQQGVLEIFDHHFYLNRYDPEIIPFYLAALNGLEADQKALVIRHFLTSDFTSSEGPYPSQIDQVDPAIYPKIFEFIADAQKYKLTANIMQYLADAKQTLLYLYTKHGLNPPTEAELAAMPFISARPGGTVPPPAPGSNTTRKPTPPADTLTSLSFYIFFGALVLFGGILFLRRK